MLFRPEPPFTHDAPEKTGIVLVNLGTPRAASAREVRRYLREFLADPRVVEIPRAVWALILHGIVLNVRPRRSAKKYAAIWTQEGSPLAVHTARQAVLLRGFLGAKLGAGVVIDYAMRYGEPPIAAALERMQAARCVRILVIPLYPQYAASTTASAMDAVFRFMARTRNLPEVRFIKHFHDDPGYVEALALRVRAHWETHGRPDKLVMSFHGLPRYTLERGDPYHCECHTTARLLADRLRLDAGAWTVSFQSRFGRTRWLQPYTVDVVRALAASGSARVDVVTPGFVSDCLETLEEIGIEARDLFLRAGGKEFFAIPCLNEEPAWIEALASMAVRELQAWRPHPDPDALAARRERAMALGSRA
jgi:ferrochelatase